MWPVFSHSSLKSYKARICTDRIYHKVSKTLFFFLCQATNNQISLAFASSGFVLLTAVAHVGNTSLYGWGTLRRAYCQTGVPSPVWSKEAACHLLFGEWGGLCPQIVSVNMRQRLDRSAENKWQSYRLRNICTYFLKDSLYFMIYAGCGRVHR